ncbi:uncharacterized protein L201_000549 [Kwoniella dendrophila CBS 6074]|uniref:Mitochondrial import inner membrane translocase subunit TIM54 n=1 Tax=Kwoniella dendrophila CBS 6074 TaxID=1295534 RepID=A0AAX4JLA8_9TREE
MSVPEHPHPPPAQPTNPSPPPQPAPSNVSSPTASPNPSISTTSSTIPTDKPINPASSATATSIKTSSKPVELTGFRSALSHTGIPHSVLTWKPKLPSRNWLIFWTLLTTISGTYYYDRLECDKIKKQTIDKVKNQSKEILPGGSLGLNRKVTVYGAKWPGDEDTDRALRYFRKYVKPYLVASAIDYDLPTSPLHGSITRTIHAKILSQRRQALGLEPIEPQLSLPGVLSPEEYKQKQLEGGIILVGRASLKEYLKGLKRGYLGNVNEWKWENEIEKSLENDGIFDEPILSTPEQLEQPPLNEESNELPPSPPAPVKPSTGLGFLSRPQQPQIQQSTSSSSSSSTAYQIPERYHIPPTVLPPQPPILLLPFVNHIGFKQIPNMILDFFTERYKVKEGSEAALALINNSIRSFDSSKDLNFDIESENYYNKDSYELPTKIEQARKDYYENLKIKIDESRKYDNGEREMTSEEIKSGKVISIQELKDERKKKELRWKGNEEGWNIIKPDTPIEWDDKFNNWLNVFELPKSDNENNHESA